MIYDWTQPGPHLGRARMWDGRGREIMQAVCYIDTITGEGQLVDFSDRTGRGDPIIELVQYVPPIRVVFDESWKRGYLEALAHYRAKRKP